MEGTQSQVTPEITIPADKEVTDDTSRKMRELL